MFHFSCFCRFFYGLFFALSEFFSWLLILKQLAIPPGWPLEVDRVACCSWPFSLTFPLCTGHFTYLDVKQRLPTSVYCSLSPPRQVALSSVKWNVLQSNSTYQMRTFYFFLILFFIVLLFCTGDTLWHLQKCLQCILVKFTTSIILLYPLSPFLRIVLTGLSFSFSYMST
jgi:hypothetical protein